MAETMIKAQKSFLRKAKGRRVDYDFVFFAV